MKSTALITAHAKPLVWKKDGSSSIIAYTGYMGPWQIDIDFEGEPEERFQAQLNDEDEGYGESFNTLEGAKAHCQTVHNAKCEAFIEEFMDIGYHNYAVIQKDMPKSSLISFTARMIDSPILDEVVSCLEQGVFFTTTQVLRYLGEHYAVEKDPLAYVKKIGMELSTLYDDTIYFAKGDVVHSYLAYRSTK